MTSESVSEWVSGSQCDYNDAESQAANIHEASLSITVCHGATNGPFTTMNWSQALLQQLHVSQYPSFCLFFSPVPETDQLWDTSSRHDGMIRCSKTASVPLSVPGTVAFMFHELVIKWSNKRCRLGTLLSFTQAMFDIRSHFIFIISTVSTDFLTPLCHHLVWNINSSQRTKLKQRVKVKHWGRTSIIKLSRVCSCCTVRVYSRSQCQAVYSTAKC